MTWRMRGIMVAVAASLVVPVTRMSAQKHSRSQQQEKKEQNDTTCPMHDAHMHGAQSTGGKSTASMAERGERGMGFSQTATTHHFVVTRNGGVIQLNVNEPTDTANRDAIRQHLAHIAEAFSSGDFDIPMFVHDAVPPGVPEMKRLRAKIRYSYGETERGGRVVIATADKESLEAIHKFLRFQIAEHKTGDPTELH